MTNFGGKKYIAVLTILLCSSFFTVAFLLDIKKLEKEYPYSGYLFLKPCGFKEKWGIPCPTCYLTRAIVSALDGKIIESIKYQPFGIILIIAASVLAIEAFFILFGKSGFLFFTSKWAVKAAAITLLLFFISWLIVIFLNYKKP